MNPLPLVLAEIRAGWWRHVAIMLLVAVAVALGVAISAQDRALRQGSASAADPFDLIIGAAGSDTQLVLSTVYLQPGALDLMPARILAELHQRDDVAFASPIGFGDSFQGYPLVGVTPALVTHLAGGGALDQGRVFARLDEAVIGAEVALAIDQRFTPLHGMSELVDDEVHHDDFSFTVAGALPPLGSPWDQAILVPIEAVWWLHALPLGHVVDDALLYPEGVGHEPDLAAVAIGPPFDDAELAGMPAITVEPASIGAAYSLRQAYRADAETTAVFPAEVLIQLYGLLGDVRDILALISIVTQVLVIAAIMLAVFGNLAQQQKQLAVLRALGAPRIFIFLVVWLDVALTLSIGALLGLVLGYGLAWLLAMLFANQTAIALGVTLGWNEIGLVVAIVLAGMSLALAPSLTTYRRSIARTLQQR
ncbi:MAG: FtsX-like permease family protein [Alphaproteobacteria bacterium]